MSAWNVPYLVGDKVNRDHQYWPVVSPAEFLSFAGAPPRLAGITRDTLLAMTWRVKTWELSGHVSATVPASPNGAGGYPGLPVTFDWDLPTTDELSVPLRYSLAVAAKEVDIIADAFLPYTGIPEKDKFFGLRNRGFSLDFSSGVPPVSITVSGPNAGYYLGYTGLSNPFNAFMAPPSYISIFLTDIVGGTVPPTVYKGREFVVYDSTAGLFYPFTDFKGLILGGGGTNGQGIEFYVDPTGLGNLNIDPLVTPAMDLPMKVDGSLVNAFVAHPFPDPTSFGIAEFQMTATEFWPYTNTLGQPVYDTSTGALLHDPFA